jgi:hypothetical protein
MRRSAAYRRLGGVKCGENTSLKAETAVRSWRAENEHFKPSSRCVLIYVGKQSLILTDTASALCKS